jgi:hypothetical protein
MCVILDANIANLVFPTPSTSFGPVHRAVNTKKARLVYGGELTTEYKRMDAFWRILLRLDQQGSARQVPDQDVQAETERLVQLNVCASDDPHIIALARIGKVRLLCTNDQALTDDFTNPDLISEPRGKVYKRPAHKRLIATCCAPFAGTAPGRRRRRRQR